MTVLTADPTTYKAFAIEPDGELAVVWFDLPGEKVNKLSSWVLEELDSLVTHLATRSDLKQIVIASRKPSIFIAGADVTEFTRVTSSAQAEEFTRFGQRVFLKVGRLPQIVVAAIHGACMGGGTELALNCDFRVMSDSPKSIIALPEVQLGIFPAWTGTTLLPRLIGLPAALDMILTGKKLDARRAKKIGLVDEVVPEPILIAAAKQLARKSGGKRSRDSNRTHFYLEGNPLARRLIFRKARASVIEKTGGHYPAPLKALEVMDTGFKDGIEAGVRAEARGASELIMGEVAQNLVRIFFLMEEAKKDQGPAPLPILSAGVLGAGLMGGGIAQIIADKAEVNVRMKDIHWKAIAGGMQAASKVWRKKLERRRMTRGEMARKTSLITGSTDWTGFRDVDVAIEAVVERLDIKQQVLAEFESIAKPSAIFATNTSTIPITQIAARAARPENVVGMHFFNPVDRMPLVEVIAGEKTSPQAIATIASFAKKLGKTVVLCKDGPGFVVNRILGPYMNEAAFLLEEGHSIESIDEAMLGFGMPMGPLALLDEVGIDVAVKAGQVLSSAFGERASPSRVPEALVKDERFGRKNGRGVYVWKDGKRVEGDPAVYALVGAAARRESSRGEMALRMVLMMVNEAARILEEKIVASAAELDLAMIMGTGFPPFRGGLLRWADGVGMGNVTAKLDALAAVHGKRFEPSAAIRRLSQKVMSFYEAYPKMSF